MWDRKESTSGAIVVKDGAGDSFRQGTSKPIPRGRTGLLNV